MDIPKCRLCGEKHWQRDGCGFEVEGEPPSEYLVSLIEELKAEVQRLTGVNEELIANMAAHENRKKYMREYMKNKRVEEKK